jgi:hypothetical protein
MCWLARQLSNLFITGYKKDSPKHVRYIGYLKLASAKWTLFTASFVMLSFLIQCYPLIALLNEVKVNKSTLKDKERDGFLINNADLI